MNADKLTIEGVTYWRDDLVVPKPAPTETLIAYVTRTAIWGSYDITGMQGDPETIGEFEVTVQGDKVIDVRLCPYVKHD